MRFRNLTPHMVNVYLNDTEMITFPPDGTVARLAVTREPRESIVGIPVVRPTLGAITGLPDLEPGVALIVSALVAEVAKRPDVFSPGELLRDDAGNIIGCRGLCIYV